RTTNGRSGLPTSASSFAAAVWAILRKECRTEWRTRYGLNASLLFAITTLTSVSFAAGRLGDRADLLGALLWIVLLFASLASLPLLLPVVAAAVSGTRGQWQQGSIGSELKLLAGFTAAVLGASILLYDHLWND